MARRTFHIATLLSTILCAISVLLFLAGYVCSPWDHYLTVSDDFHVGVWGGGFDSRIVFFNNAEYGPYRGSLIGLEGTVHPPLEREESFGDAWGVYYRYFQWPDSTLWTLMVSLWYPLIVFAIMPVAMLLGWTRRRRAASVASQTV